MDAPNASQGSSDMQIDVAAAEPRPSNGRTKKRMDLPVDRIGVTSTSATGEERYFDIIETRGDGNCMFRAISLAMYSTEDRHSECRRSIVEFILSDANWPGYSIHVAAQRDDYVLRGRGPARRCRGRKKEEDTAVNEGDEETLKALYKTCMLRDRTYGTSIELTAAGDLYQFDVITFRQYGPRESFIGRSYFYNVMSYNDDLVHPVTHHFLFSGRGPNTGHFEYLKPISLVPDVDPDNLFRIHSGYYRIAAVDEVCIHLERYFGNPGEHRNVQRDATSSDGSSSEAETDSQGSSDTSEESSGNDASGDEEWTDVEEMSDQ